MAEIFVFQIGAVIEDIEHLSRLTSNDLTTGDRCLQGNGEGTGPGAEILHDIGASEGGWECDRNAGSQGGIEYNRIALILRRRQNHVAAAQPNRYRLSERGIHNRQDVVGWRIPSTKITT